MSKSKNSDNLKPRNPLISFLAVGSAFSGFSGPSEALLGPHGAFSTSYRALLLSSTPKY